MESPENSCPEKDDHDEPAKRSCKNNARRFTDEQIKSLESIFKVETKLEPRKKVEIARDLGLEPRQVAIWFQNRRARWKSKQIEQEYKVLRANYDSLSMQFDELKKEKQSLQMQLKELSDLVKNANDHKVNTNTDRDGELKELYPNSSNERLIMEHNNDFINTYEAGDAKISKYYFEKREDQELLSWGEEEEEEMSHLASPETWCNLIDQSSGTSTWW